jgi:glycosyltransferase involved in cell wall biosynthesis
MNRSCIIIPCFNEAVRIDINAFKEVFMLRDDIDFCFVNDGSNDKTLDVLHHIKSESEKRVNILNLEKNVGKAEAVRQGFLSCLNKGGYFYYGYMDADLAAPMNQLMALIDYGFKHEKQFVFGSRVKRLGAQIERNEMRHYLGRVFATISYMIVKLPIYDTQCGLKIMTAKLAEIAFKDGFISRWAFDIEIFIKLRNADIDIYSAMIEIPLSEWYDRKGSKLKIIDMFLVPKDLFKIWKNYSS